jgi:hypothetical protein
MGRYFQFTAIGDCIWLRILRIVERLNQKRPSSFVDFVMEEFRRPLNI